MSRCKSRSRDRPTETSNVLEDGAVMLSRTLQNLPLQIRLHLAKINTHHPDANRSGIPGITGGEEEGTEEEDGGGTEEGRKEGRRKGRRRDGEGTRRDGGTEEGRRRDGGGTEIESTYGLHLRQGHLTAYASRP